MKHLAPACGVGVAPAAVPGYDDPPVPQARERRRRVRPDEARRLRLGPGDAVAREGLVEQPALAPDQNPDPTIPQLEDDRLDAPLVRYRAGGNRQSGGAAAPRGAAVVGVERRDVELPLVEKPVEAFAAVPPRAVSPVMDRKEDAAAPELSRAAQRTDVALEDARRLAPATPALARAHVPDIQEAVTVAPFQQEEVHLAVVRYERPNNTMTPFEWEHRDGWAPGSAAVGRRDGGDRLALASGLQVVDLEPAVGQADGDGFGAGQRADHERLLGGGRPGHPGQETGDGEQPLKARHSLPPIPAAVLPRRRRRRSNAGAGNRLLPPPGATRQLRRAAHRPRRGTFPP